MDFPGKIKSALEKLQSLPESQKKIILWVVVGILAVVLGGLWSIELRTNFAKIKENIKNVELPDLGIKDAVPVSSVDINIEK